MVDEFLCIVVLYYVICSVPLWAAIVHNFFFFFCGLYSFLVEIMVIASSGQLFSVVLE